MSRLEDSIKGSAHKDNSTEVIQSEEQTYTGKNYPNLVEDINYRFKNLRDSEAG